MKKQVLVPVANGTEELEAIAIIDLLRRGGAEVTVSSVHDKEVLCANGSRLVADNGIVECAGRVYDLIVLPGGDEGAKSFRDSDVLVQMLKEQDKAGRTLAAICASPAVVLSHHGLIKERAATCYPSYEQALKNKAKIGERVVVDGNLITSKSPGTAVEFALKLVECVIGQQQANQIAQGILAR